MSSTGERRLGAGAIAKKLAPYLIAAIALAWVFKSTDRKKLMEALHHAPIVAFVLFSTLIILLNCAADTFAMSSVFRRFGVKVPYKDLYLVRASTYLLAVVNYHVGQAAIVGYLYRVRRVPLLRASGWILFIIGINVGTLFLLASAGATRVSDELRPLRYIPLACGIGIVVYAILLTWKPRVLAERRILQPLFEMGITGHLYGLVVRLPHIGVLLLWHYVSLHMFRVQVPPGAALLYLPAYFAASSIPGLSVNGLGMPQVIAVYFFAPYFMNAAGTGDRALGREAVMAYSLATAGISIVLQMALGLVCLRWAAARGLKPQAIEDVAEAATG